jgi:hypothetical protein
MRKLVSISLLVVFILSILSCEKTITDPTPDPTPIIPTPPSINFSQPSASMYPIGSLIPIMANITDNEQLSKVLVTITNSASSDSIYMSINLNQKDYSLDTNFTDNSQPGSHTNYNIKVVAIDKDQTKIEGYKFVHVMN